MSKGQRHDSQKQDKQAPVDRRGFKTPEPLVTEPRRDGERGLKKDNPGSRSKKKRKPKKGKAAMRIKQLIEERLAKGETYEQIVEKARLDETERNVLKIYVLAEERITQKKTAKILKIELSAVSHAVNSIDNKLLSDGEIMEKIRKYGVRSSTQLHGKNYGLFKAAKDKGLLDKMLQNELLSALLERKVEEALTTLTGFEREVVNQIILRKGVVSVEVFSEQHELEVTAVLDIMSRMVRKLRGEKVENEVLYQIKKHVETLDQKKFEKFRSLLNKQELKILEKRVLAKIPATFEEIGIALKISKQRVKQIEVKLLEKIERRKKGKGLFQSQSNATRRIKQLIKERLAKGETLDQIMEKAGLNETEIKVFEIYVLAKERITQKEAGNKIGKKQYDISKAIRKIEDKLLGKRKRSRRADRKKWSREEIRTIKSMRGPLLFIGYNDAAIARTIINKTGITGNVYSKIRQLVSKGELPENPNKRPVTKHIVFSSRAEVK
jgi:hypothetical protein